MREENGRIEGGEEKGIRVVKSEMREWRKERG